MTNRRQSGTRGEDAAVDFLLKNKYRILRRNYRFERGEIDIIAEDGPVLVFVEVKTRRSKRYGEPEEAVTESKRRQIRKVAGGFLFEEGIEDKECRFDVVAVDLSRDERTVRHIEAAF